MLTLPQNKEELYELLENRYQRYNKQDFIALDPIAIPHRFSQKQDQEIMGFWAAMLAWGNRKTIIKKSEELITLMDNAPYDFVRNYTDKDLKPFLKFKHRTFNATDTLYFLDFFKRHYQKFDSLEQAFTLHLPSQSQNIEQALIGFHHYFFQAETFPERTRKHIATPERHSACKRLNRFLRWMVRKDEQGVDLGIWNNISPAQLVCPCDVHVERVAKKLQLLDAKTLNWKTAVALTERLKTFDAHDPVKYDFALFGLGIMEKW